MPSNDESEKEEFAEKLAIYGTSLKDYLLSLNEGATASKYGFTK